MMKAGAFISASYLYQGTGTTNSHLLHATSNAFTTRKDDGKLPAVAVQRFETPAYLRQGRIIYRQSPEQVGFYDYHRWASDPGQVVTTALIGSLRAAGVFSVVKRMTARSVRRISCEGVWNA